jgi:transposase InsO family protein
LAIWPLEQGRNVGREKAVPRPIWDFAFIEPGSPCENGYRESFNSKLRDELLNGEIFYGLAEARVIIEAWRRYYNTERTHSSLTRR